MEIPTYYSAEDFKKNYQIDYMQFADQMSLPTYLHKCKKNVGANIFFDVFKLDIMRELDADDEELLDSINKTKEEIELVLQEMFHEKMQPDEVIKNSNVPEQNANSNDLNSAYSNEIIKIANVVFFGDWKKLDLLYYLNDNFDPGARNFTQLTKYNQIYYFLNQLYKDSGGTIPKEQYKSLIKKVVEFDYQNSDVRGNTDKHQLSLGNLFKEFRNK